ncbi:MAG: tetratricopeptide repeat protein [Thermodesulfovibrionales bacterium]|nr:tetratricopeptide repeat protein [Thermodesulfovibrionales bacterium]
MNKKIILIFFLITVLCACASVSQEDQKQAYFHYQIGMSYFHDNNIQPAYVELQKALELNPYDKQIHNALGIIYLSKLEDYPKAVEHFKKALKYDEDYAEAYTNIGNAYAKMGEFNKAIESYRTAISNPFYRNQALALYNLGMVYYRLARYDLALDAFKDSIRRYSTFPLPYYGMALTYNAQGMYGDAATAITHAIEFDPLYKGDMEKASQDFKNRKIQVKGQEEKDIASYLDILKY